MKTTCQEVRLVIGKIPIHRQLVYRINPRFFRRRLKMPPMTVEIDGTIPMETSLNESLNVEARRVLTSTSSLDSIDTQSSSSSSSASSSSNGGLHPASSPPPPPHSSHGLYPGTPPIRCPHCPFITTQNYKLVRHTKAVHTKEKSYKCPHCDLSFLEKCVLVRHVRIVHEKHRDFVCEQCDKTFASNANLKQVSSFFKQRRGEEG